MKTPTGKLRKVPNDQQLLVYGLPDGSENPREGKWYRGEPELQRTAGTTVDARFVSESPNFLFPL
ncbi:MAG: hypothetical protein BGP13_09820 [Sphingobacteriales bacterium 40-81]|nr:MAG: hypothetical protein BGP13_09820 [Sphingobacteriales bacterium 40-81]